MVDVFFARSKVADSQKVLSSLTAVMSGTTDALTLLLAATLTAFFFHLSSARFAASHFDKSLCTRRRCQRESQLAAIRHPTQLEQADESRPSALSPMWQVQRLCGVLCHRRSDTRSLLLLHRLAIAPWWRWTYQRSTNYEHDGYF